MKRTLLFIIVAAITATCLLAGCAASVHVNKDKQINFKKYKTFAWINGNDGKKSKADDLENKNVHDAVTTELLNSRWKEVSGNPDVLISYDVLIQRSTIIERNPVYSRATSRLYFNPYTNHYGTISYPSQFWGYNDYNVPVSEGTLTLTVTDANTDKTVWQAWTTGKVNSRRLSHKEVQGIIKSIFRKFDIAK